MQVIPRLWGSLVARIHELRPEEPGVFYGLCEGGLALGETISRVDELFYLAAVPVAPTAPLPPGMCAWDAPGGLHAKFTHRGHVNGIGKAMDDIYASWFPTSGYSSAGGPDIERYGAGFGPSRDDNVIELFIPVRDLRPRATGADVSGAVVSE